MSDPLRILTGLARLAAQTSFATQTGGEAAPVAQNPEKSADLATIVPEKQESVAQNDTIGSPGSSFSPLSESSEIGISAPGPFVAQSDPETAAATASAKRAERDRNRRIAKEIRAVSTASPTPEDITETALADGAIATLTTQDGEQVPDGWRENPGVVSAVALDRARLRDDIAWSDDDEETTGAVAVDPSPDVTQVGANITVTVKIPKALITQGPILTHSARYKMVRAGRRFGKTRLGFIAAVRGHGPRVERKRSDGTAYTGFRWRGIQENADIVWLVPDFPQGMAIWQEEIVPRFAGVPGIRLREKDFSVTLASGGRLRLWTVKNIRSLRGKRLDGVIIDEAAFIKLRSIWKEIVRPTLIDRRGWAIIISSTQLGSDFNAMIREVEDDMTKAEQAIATQAMTTLGKIMGPPGSIPAAPPAYHRKRQRWHSWHFKTSDNPRISRAELAELAEDYPPGSAEAAQELDAELLETLGTLFKTEWWKTYGAASRIAMQGGDLENARYQFFDFFVTVDLAASENEGADYTACTAAGVTGRDGKDIRRVGILDVLNERLEGPDSIEAIYQFCVKWHPKVVFVESSGYQLTAVQTLKKRLAAKRIEVRAWNPRGKGDKRARSIPYAAMVSRGEVFLPAIAPWKDAWLAQHAKFPNGKDGSVRVEDHDDMVDTGSMLADVLEIRTTRKSGGFKKLPAR